MNPTTPYSLYIHWPFCHKKCHYCDFIALEKHNDFQAKYHHALMREIDVWAQARLHTGTLYPPKTIFLGGGTPSLYPTPLITELLQKLNGYFNGTLGEEITIETNPADITTENLELWRSLGINRLSMGVQILDDQILARLNRHQRTQDVYNAMAIAPQYFTNISVDLIVGLPGATEQIWQKTINQVLTWPINHISIYLLTIHEQTQLYFDIIQNNVVLPNEEQTINLLESTYQELKKHNFLQYEISNYAKPNYESIHNQGYWNRQEYKGFGLGASSFEIRENRSIRTINEKNLDRYIKTIENNAFEALGQQEILTQEQEKIETIMLSLRQTSGVDLHRVVYLLKDEEKNRFFETVDMLVSEKFLSKRNGKIALTHKGILLEHEILARLI